VVRGYGCLVHREVIGFTSWTYCEKVG